ncbi:Cation/H+ exchanger [Trinorchestia longiramus]|nr:Cation/H+ exchanger [Trinorchestia longiramus]
MSPASQVGEIQCCFITVVLPWDTSSIQAGDLVNTLSDAGERGTCCVGDACERGTCCVGDAGERGTCCVGDAGERGTCFVGEGSDEATSRAPEEDEDNSDCLSTTTSTSALTALSTSQPNIPGQSGLSLPPPSYSSDPSGASSPTAVVPTPSGTYDNPAADLTETPPTIAKSSKSKSEDLVNTQQQPQNHTSSPSSPIKPGGKITTDVNSGSSNVVSGSSKPTSSVSSSSVASPSQQLLLDSSDFTSKKVPQKSLTSGNESEVQPNPVLSPTTTNDPEASCYSKVNSSNAPSHNMHSGFDGGTSTSCLNAPPTSLFCLSTPPNGLSNVTNGPCSTSCPNSLTNGASMNNSNGVYSFNGFSSSSSCGPVPSNSTVNNSINNSISHNNTFNITSANTTPLTVNSNATNSTTAASNGLSNTTSQLSNTTCHSRCSSWVSGGVTSGTQTVCHSRGASTEGSTMDAFSASATDSRRGTYSEAGTLPIGSLPEGSLGGTIIEEEHPLEPLSEKKLSSEDSSSGDRDNEDSKKRSKSAIMRQLGSLGSCLKYCTCCRPLMQEHNPLPTNPTRADRLKYAFTCPPHGKVGVLLTHVTLLLLTWGSLYAITGDAAAPGGNLFSLLVVFVCSVLGGKLTQVCGLPPLLGMLLVGIALRSVPGLMIIGESLDPEWSASIRNIALVVILLRAGLGLDPHALKAMSFVVFRLAFTPCIVETVVVAIVTHFLLGFPWLWGFMLGFILAAVSPAVVVPCLLQLSQKGYGVEKGIPTLVIAAASVDDVLAISGFGVLLGMTFSDGSLAWQIMHGPIEVLMGLSYGVGMGLLCWVLPNKHHQDCSLLQFAMLFTAGLFALFGSQRIEFGGAGALAVLCMAFIAGVGYRRQGWGDDDNPVGQHCNIAWSYLQPMLFALIGTQIQILQLELDTIGLGVATLCVSLTCRVVTTFFVVLGSGLNIRERLFVALAWLPKATVQAAIGSTALDYANRIGADEDQIVLAKQVLTIAVLVILITAPIGAIAIMTSAPRLLQRARRPSASDTV